MIVRPAREVDYDELARVWYQGYRASSYGDVPPPEITEVYLRNRIPDDIANRGWDPYAVEEDGRIVAVLATIPRERALDQIFLGDGARGSGVGRQVLNFVKQKMTDGFWLRTHITNVKAQGFYEHEGMVHMHDVPHPHHPEAMFRWYAWKP